MLSTDSIRPIEFNELSMSVTRERALREGCKSSTILQNTTRLSGMLLRRDARPIPFIFKGFWRFPHHSRFISHRSDSSCFPASHSLFGPYSPFRLDLVRTSSRRVNPFRINGLSQNRRFRGLWDHVLCLVLSTRAFEPLVRQFGKASGRSLVARIGMETEFSLSQAVASGDAFEHRASERGHCVEDFSAELNLRDLPGEAAGFEFGADDALPTAHLRFYSAALVVPCCRLPSHAPVAADLAKMAIPNGRITRRLRADHCVLWRWYDHIQGLPIPLPQQISCG